MNMETDEPVFRRATENDVPKIMELYKSVLGDELTTWSEEYPTEREIYNDLGSDDLFVMADGDTIAGAISIEPENEQNDLDCWQVEGRLSGEIARVVVAKEYRGKNLSAKMVRIVSMMLREKGKAAAHLLVAKKNIPAQKVYQRCGFASVGETFMYGADYYCYEKIL